MSAQEQIALAADGRPWDAAERTREALALWAAALGGNRFLMLAVPADGDGPVLLRRLDAEGLVGATSWLRALNSRGHHLYGRPLTSRLILVNDLRQDGMLRLGAERPVRAVVETSPASFQAWVEMAPPGAPEPVPGEAGSLARTLAAAYGGDVQGARARRLGRLPGLLNRHARHLRADGRRPVALLRWVPVEVRAALAATEGGRSGP